MNSPLPNRCWADIDLVALAENVHSIRASVPQGTRYISVVKANTYGVGVREAVPAIREAGADWLAVANIGEAVRIREFDAKAPILLLSGTIPEEDPFLWECRLTPTVSTTEEVERYQRGAKQFGRTLEVHLKVDTGMGRLGVWHERLHELVQAIRRAPGVRVIGLYSHFASADDNPAFTTEQRNRFRQALPELLPIAQPETLIHIDNSAGLASFVSGDCWNTVRVGLLQLGIPPSRDLSASRIPVRPVVSWHARLSVIKELPAGASVSYGQTCRLNRNSRIAIVTAGYADGIPRSASNRAFLLVRGRRCPVLGRVTMDEIAIDVTDLPEAASGDVATIVGRQRQEEITMAEFSDCAQTIPWESLCAISSRVTRVYHRTRPGEGDGKKIDGLANKVSCTGRP
jgi:alanine racemase